LFSKYILMKTYLIIGASSGIGLQLATTLADEGNNVIGTFNSHPVEDVNPNISYQQLNVLDAEIDFSFLPEVLDGVVYCPGSINLKPFARIKPEDFTNDFNLQVGGLIKVLQAAQPLLKKNEHASVVVFSTVAVQVGLPFHTQVSASKGAIEGLTKALSAEWAPSIRINCIAPSLTDTPLAAQLLNTEEKKSANALRHPLKKIGTATDIANMAAFLLSEKASWITGQVMHVDGGMSTVKV
jgi:NAD(P)-dependent dehydrogenase (short-subunit alcohol dehydrogenase family)